jgi:hypothetical protein
MFVVANTTMSTFSVKFIASFLLTVQLLAKTYFQKPNETVSFCSAVVLPVHTQSALKWIH